MINQCIVAKNPKRSCSNAAEQSAEPNGIQGCSNTAASCDDSTRFRPPRFAR